jgi:hypothetical protein
MFISTSRVLRETLACFFEQFRGHLQISLCRLNIDVTKVGRQLWEQTLHVLAIAVPRNNPMHRRRMPQIVQARRM